MRNSLAGGTSGFSGVWLAILFGTAMVAGSGMAEQTGQLEKATASVYGYVKMDAVWDDSMIMPGNYATYVADEDKAPNRDEFLVTARETRLGARIAGGGSEGVEAMGTVEGDFYGGTLENKSNVMLRHAFLEVSWPGKGVSLIAGQTWDLVGPLNPSVLNYSVMWCSGNVGYRRPQLRVTKTMSICSDQRVELAVAAARTIVETGLLNSGFPTGQARVGYAGVLPGGRKVAIGVSGHYGEFMGDPGDGRLNSFQTWSVVGDFTMFLVAGVSLKGELWSGENLEAYQGGVGQGILNAASKCIGASGGWVMVDSGIGPWTLGLGCGLDDPRNGNLAAEGKARNGAVFGKVTYAITQAVTCGLEVSHWETRYKDAAKDAESARVQGSMIYRF